MRFESPSYSLAALANCSAQFCIDSLRRFSQSRRGRFGITLSNQLADHKVLLKEPLLPTTQILELLLIQVRKVIQGSLQILGEHLLIKALAGQSTRGITSSKVLVRATLHASSVSCQQFLWFPLQ